MLRVLVALPLLCPALAAQGALPRLDPSVRLGVGTVEFGRIDYAAAALGGEVVAVDGENFRLYRFSANGVLRDSLGARGEGPGEFRAAAGLRVGPAGEVALADILNRRVTVWPAAGQPSSQVAISNRTPLAMPAWENGPVVTLTNFVDQLTFTVVRPGHSNAELHALPIRAIPVQHCEQCPVTPLGSGRLLMAATVDSSYRLLEFGPGGRLMRTWQRPATPPRRRSDADVDALVTRMSLGPAGASGSPEGRRTSPDRERFRYPPRITALERDGAGRVWALAQHAGTSHGAFDVFAPQGTFLGTVRFAEPIRGFSIAGDRLVAWGEDANDEPALWSYRIR